MKHTLRLAAAALAAGALAMLGTAVPSANAATSDPLIDPTATTHLYIQKYLGDPGVEATGLPQTVSGMDALSGVKFDVYQVADAGLGGTCPSTAWVDLTTNEGWDAAAALNGYVPPQGTIQTTFVYPSPGGHTYCLGTPTTVTTDATGLATFTHTGPGLYLVDENLATSTNIQKNGTGDIISPSAVSPSSPFLVTLPMTNPSTLTGWMYDVYVYPKNQEDTVTKTVADQGTVTDPLATGTAASHTVTFTITSSISDRTQDKYVITDTLDSRLILDSVEVKIDVPSPGTDIVLTQGDASANYTLTGTFVVTFNPSGLALLAAHKDATVVTTVTTHLDPAAALGDGVITNTAYVVPNQAWYDNHWTEAAPGIPSGTTESRYGSFKLTKMKSGTTTPVANAGFTLYGAGTDQVCTSADLTTANIIFPEQKTASDGTLTFTGVQLSDFYDNSPQSGTAMQRYCLVETTAPTGYNLLAKPILVTVDQAGALVDLPTVYNQLKNLGNALPLTGGRGVAVLSIGGALLVGAGLGYYLVFLRRHRNAE